MAEFFEARALHYEIHALIGGRWRLDAIMSAEAALDRAGFAALEQDAVARATALLAGKTGVAAVKVVRERRRDDGFVTSREIFAKQAPPTPKVAPLAIGQVADTDPVAASPCRELPDLYSRASCRAISVLMRSLLDRLSITPLELLHHGPYARRLDDNWALVAAGVGQVARLQARADGTIGAAERAACLQSLVDRAIDRARKAEHAPALPRFAGDMAAWSAAIAGIVGADQHGFSLRVAIASHFAGTPGYLARLEFAIAGLDRTVDPVAADALDGFAAGCLESPLLVMDLLGPQPNLAAALLALTALASGELAAKTVPAATPRLRDLIRRGALPHSAAALWERILRELVRTKPLSRHDGGEEWALLMRLRDILPAAASPPWRLAITRALDERVRRARDTAA